MPKKAFVSGCFDLLHSGHVAFFEEAARYGELYVAIGSDRNVFELKRRPTINSEAERLYMIKSLAYVKDVFVAKGSGVLDFVQELAVIKPDYFVVNEDGSTPAKKNLCEELGIEYVILKREPHSGLAARSTTALRGASLIPDYIGLAGGCLDLPEISRLAPGPAITISIQPLPEHSSSTRRAAIELWDARLPADKPEKLAKVLFGYTNLPGTAEIRGSKAALGICLPGVSRTDYSGQYWPERLTNQQDEAILKFIEDSLIVIPFDLQTTSSYPHKMTARATEAHCRAAEACWQAILKQDKLAFGQSLTASFESQTAMLPPDKTTQELIATYREQVLGWNICDLGLLLVTDKPLENATRISLRHAND
ncbi:MAG: adenylyltransferase/cytidyltransferase family protein [Chloroflexi bacterium]|nr:adenylyltransferase/cytidyltransferase family protein [Chloroflexota bacterium]